MSFHIKETEIKSVLFRVRLISGVIHTVYFAGYNVNEWPIIVSCRTWIEQLSLDFHTELISVHKTGYLTRV